MNLLCNENFIGCEVKSRVINNCLEAHQKMSERITEKNIGAFILLGKFLLKITKNGSNEGVYIITKDYSGDTDEAD